MNHHYKLRTRQPEPARLPTDQDEPEHNHNSNSNRDGDEDDDDYRPSRNETYITSGISRLNVTPEAGSELHTTTLAPVASTQVEWATVNTRPQADFVAPLPSRYSKQPGTTAVDRTEPGRSAPLDNRKHGAPEDIRLAGAKRMRETLQVNVFPPFFPPRVLELTPNSDGTRRPQSRNPKTASIG